MSALLAIRISNSPFTSFLHDGRPVFPVCNASHERVLLQVAELHGATLEFVDVVTDAPTTTRYFGVVVALGEENAFAARLYASLTGRSFATAADVPALSQMPDVSVVVLTTQRLQGKLLQHLYVERRDLQATAPGLLVAPGQDALIEVVLRAAASLALSDQEGAGRSFLFPREAFDHQRQGGDLFVGSLATNEVMDEALAAGSAILSIHSHSNGFDTWIGETRLLCPFSERFPADGISATPLCVENGRCSRFPSFPPVERLRKQGRLVAPAVLAGRIVLVYSCGVLKVAEDLIDPRYGLAVQLAGQSNLGTLITTWHSEREDASRTALNSLFNELSSGLTVGEAVARFSRTPLARYYATSLCILGDPAYRIPSLQGARHLPEASLNHPDVLWNTMVAGDVLSRVRLLTEGIRAALDEGADLPPERVDCTLKALSDVGQAPTQAAVGIASKTVADLIARWPWLDDFLLAKGRVGQSDDTCRCASCGAPARRYDLLFDPARGVSNRSVLDCTSCGEIHNVPKCSRLRLDERRLPLGKLALEGVASDAVASVSYLSFEYSTSVTTPWPTGADGRLLEEIDIPTELPAGPILCKVAVCWSLEIGLVGARFRRSVNGELVLPAVAPYA